MKLDKTPPKILYVPYFKEIDGQQRYFFHEYNLFWSKTKGASYKDDDGKTHKISLIDAKFYNNLEFLINIEYEFALLFPCWKKYIDFWQIRRADITVPYLISIKKNINDFLDLKDTSWLISKMFSSSNVFLTSILSLYSNVSLLLSSYINKNVFPSQLLEFKKALILNTYLTVQSFIIAINSIYLSLYVSGKDLVKYDRNLDKLNDKDFENIPNSLFWKNEVSEQFKKDYDDLLWIRNITVHPFSVKEKGSDNSYWQIFYHQIENYNFEYFEKLNNGEISLVKINRTNVNNFKNWIETPNPNTKSFYEYHKYPIVDICTRMLNEILNYFKGIPLK